MILLVRQELEVRELLLSRFAGLTQVKVVGPRQVHHVANGATNV
jgi:hypothetical protein